MSKLMIAMPSDKTPPLYDFFNDELNEKQRQKLLSLFALMLQAPVSVMREPYVKHFTLERYSSLYELRAKSKTLVRIIFTMTPDGDVLFLTPFVKQHRRDTMQALESSLSLLDRMLMLLSGAVHRIFCEWRKNKMKQKLILTCAAAAVPALLYALYRRWWKHA